jgi:SAM-dependent methyltransferase
MRRSQADQFEMVGEGLIRMLEAEDMLDTQTDLLDVGCGCGRVARYLVDRPLHSYTGFFLARGTLVTGVSHNWYVIFFGVLSAFAFTTFSPSSPGSLQPCLCSLPNNIPLKFSECSENMVDEFPP